jgi:hypothetical protein
MEPAVDPSLCPAGGAPNTCGMSQGKSDCWCFSASIPKGALERIPTEAKDVACLCPRCAQIEAEASATPRVESKPG